MFPHASTIKVENQNTCQCFFGLMPQDQNPRMRTLGNAYSIMFVWKWMDSLGAQKILNKSTSTHVINKYSILWVMQTNRQALLFGQNSSDFCIWLLETVTITISMDETTGWRNARMHDDMIKTFWHQTKRNCTSIDQIKTNQWDLMCPDCWSNGICPAPKAKVA